MVHVGEQKFHTPLDLANFLVSLIPEGQFSKVADICCGSWNLLNATKDRWPNINITGVDLDKNASLKKPTGASFKLIDGRIYALNSMKTKRFFDLIVANPPFGKIDKKILIHSSDISLCANIRGLACTRIETEMMIANASLVHPGGFLVAIVPSSFIEADSFKELRINFAKEFNIISLVRLPANAFKRTDIRSYIIVLNRKTDLLYDSNEHTNCFVASYKSSIWERSLDSIISLDNIANGIWKVNNIENTKIKNIKMFRGKISSNEFSKKGVPVLHTSTVPKNKTVWKANVRFIKSHPDLSKLPFASDGDIIVSRIGKSAGYWYIYSGTDILVSDCLIVLKSSSRKKITDLFNANSTHGRLSHLVKGITTQYVTESDLKSWVSS